MKVMTNERRLLRVMTNEGRVLPVSLHQILCFLNVAFMCQGSSVQELVLFIHTSNTRLQLCKGEFIISFIRAF